MHVQINGSTIHYREEGTPEGMPVVFLHGFPFSHAMWDSQMAALASGARLIAYDLRGHGRSDVGDGQYTIEGHVDDLFALLKELKVERPVLVGLSMGGYIALRALERSANLFRGAVLCDTRSEADTDEAKLRRAGVAGSVKRIGSAAFAREFVKGVFAEGTFTTRPEVVEKIRDIIAHTPPLSIAGTQLALAARTDTTAALPALRLPVLILVGEHDKTTPPSAARAMQERIAGSTLTIIPHAGHLSNMENPEVFNEALGKFLREVEGLKSHPQR